MNLIKHFSFDLWYTLIKSNPSFKKERALVFFKEFNSKTKPLHEVESTFKRIDLMCNSINEKTGKNIDAEEMYAMVLYEINDGTEILDITDLKKLYVSLENLFFKYPPVIFDDYTIETLEKIKQLPEITMNILSNTAFINGGTLRKLLNHLEISKYFDFQIYSDEEGISKPNPLIFEKLISDVKLKRNDAFFDEKKIIHIGDNKNADYNGAISCGLNSKIINSNGYTIKSIYE